MQKMAIAAAGNGGVNHYGGQDDDNDNLQDPSLTEGSEPQQADSDPLSPEARDAIHGAKANPEPGTSGLHRAAGVLQSLFRDGREKANKFKDYALNFAGRAGIPILSDTLKETVMKGFDWEAANDNVEQEIALPIEGSEAQAIDSELRKKSLSESVSVAEADFNAEIAHRQQIIQLSQKLVPNHPAIQTLHQITEDYQTAAKNEDTEFSTLTQKLQSEALKALKELVFAIRNNLNLVGNCQQTLPPFFAANLPRAEEFVAFHEIRALNTKMSDLHNFHSIGEFHQALERTALDYQLSTTYLAKTAEVLKRDFGDKALSFLEMSSSLSRGQQIAEGYKSLSEMTIESPEDLAKFYQEAERLDREALRSQSIKNTQVIMTLKNVFLGEEGLLSLDPKKEKVFMQLRRDFVDFGQTRRSKNYYFSPREARTASSLLNRFQDQMSILADFQTSLREDSQIIAEQVANLSNSTRIGSKNKFTVSQIQRELSKAESLSALDLTSLSQKASEFGKSYRTIKKISLAVQEYRSANLSLQLTDALMQASPDLSEPETAKLDELQVKLFIEAEAILGAERRAELEEAFNEIPKAADQLSFLVDTVFTEIKATSQNKTTLTQSPRAVELRKEISQINQASPDQLSKHPGLMGLNLDLEGPQAISNILQARKLLIQPREVELKTLEAQDKQGGTALAITRFNNLSKQVENIQTGYQKRTEGIRTQSQKAAQAFQAAMLKVKSTDNPAAAIQNWKAFQDTLTNFKNEADKIAGNDPELKAAIQKQIEQALDPRPAEQLASKYIDRFLSQIAEGRLSLEEWQHIHSQLSQIAKNSLIHDPKVLRWSDYISQCDQNRIPRAVPSDTTLKMLYFTSGKTAQMQKQNEVLYRCIVKGEAHPPAEIGCFSQFMEDKLNITFGRKFALDKDGNTITEPNAIRIMEIDDRLTRLNEGVTKMKEKLKDKPEKLQMKLAQQQKKINKLQAEKAKLMERVGTERAYRTRLGILDNKRSKVLDAVLHPDLYGIISSLPLVHRIAGVIPRFKTSGVSQVDELVRRDSNWKDLRRMASSAASSALAYLSSDDKTARTR